jgi:hypothetical protein
MVVAHESQAMWAPRQATSVIEQLINDAFLTFSTDSDFQMTNKVITE